jgi:hypothetical protein
MSLRSEAEAETATKRRSPILRFLGHYIEMVLVMFAGMLVLVPALLALAWIVGASRSDLERDAPALVLLGMGFSMTAPMVWWMRWRGHSWSATREMAGAMIVPTLGVVGLLAVGAVGDLGDLLMIQHVAMFPSMLAVMLLRREEYSHGVHRKPGSTPASETRMTVGRTLGASAPIWYRGSDSSRRQERARIRRS